MLKHLWHAIKVATRMAYDIVKGSIKLYNCKKQLITVFGGHKVKKGSKVAQDAYDFGKRVVACDYAVVTGGGSGVMNLVNQGAFENKIQKRENVCYSIVVQGLEEENRSVFTDVRTETETFFARKFLLIRFSSVFVLFPGSVGTVDEFFELMVLLQNKKMKHIPVILYGKEFWSPALDWCEKQMVAHGYMNKKYSSFFVVVDTLDEVMQQIQSACDCVC